MDLAHTYQPVELDEVSRKLMVINTQMGLFQYNRLLFGISAAPATFQQTIEGILQGIPNLCVYLDDILVTGKTEEDHLQTLDIVLSRLGEAGLHLKKNKCSFMLPSVEYLGHCISAEGLQPTNQNFRASTDKPTPKSSRAFLGLINYYGKFIKNCPCGWHHFTYYYKRKQDGTKGLSSRRRRREGMQRVQTAKSNMLLILNLRDVILRGPRRAHHDNPIAPRAVVLDV